MLIHNRWIHFYVGRDWCKDEGFSFFVGVLPQNNPSLPKGWFKPARRGVRSLFIGPVIDISITFPQTCGTVWYADYSRGNPAVVNSGWWTGRDNTVVHRRGSITVHFGN